MENVSELFKFRCVSISVGPFKNYLLSFSNFEKFFSTLIKLLLFSTVAGVLQYYETKSFESLLVFWLTSFVLTLVIEFCTKGLKYRLFKSEVFVFKEKIEVKDIVANKRWMEIKKENILRFESSGSEITVVYSINKHFIKSFAFYYPDDNEDKLNLIAKLSKWKS